MQKWFNNVVEDKDYNEYYKVTKVVKVEKVYIKRDNSKKNRTKNMNRARKAKFIRQGR